MLEDYDLMEHYENVKYWYDMVGYYCQSDK